MDKYDTGSIRELNAKRRLDEEYDKKELEEQIKYNENYEKFVNSMYEQYIITDSDVESAIIKNDEEFFLKILRNLRDDVDFIKNIIINDILYKNRSNLLEILFNKHLLEILLIFLIVFKELH